MNVAFKPLNGYFNPGFKFRMSVCILLESLDKGWAKDYFPLCLSHSQIFLSCLITSSAVPAFSFPFFNADLADLALRDISFLLSSIIRFCITSRRSSRAEKSSSIISANSLSNVAMLFYFTNIRSFDSVAIFDCLSGAGVIVK